MNCLLKLGEERQDLLNEIEDKKTKIRQVEQRNLLILNEAEEQRQDLENQLARFTSDQNYISSPVSANLFECLISKLDYFELSRHMKIDILGFRDYSYRYT